MRYFVIKEDLKYTNRPKFKNWMKYITPKQVVERDYQTLPRRAIMEISGNAESDFVDILTTPIMMVSQKVRDILVHYEPNLTYKEIILLDKKYGKAKEYFMPIVEKSECLSHKSEFNLDHSVLKRCVIDKKRIEDRCLFTFCNGPTNVFVMRIDFAESILRRGAYGFALEEAEYEE